MALAYDQQTNSDSAAPQDFVNLPTPQPRKPNLERQFKNRKAVDPYGIERKARKASSSSVTKTETNTQAASNVPDTIQWGDMMISKDASPEIWEQYAAKIRAGGKPPGGFPTAPQAQDEAMKVESVAAEKEHQKRMQEIGRPAQQPARGLATVPAGTIREPLFGRNPDGSPKSRPAGMDADEVAALAAAQERKYNPPQKPTKEKTAKAKPSSSAPAKNPPGVLGYDALNQPVYGRSAPQAVTPKPEQLNALPKELHPGRPSGNPRLPHGSVWSGSYDNNGDPIYGIPVPGMKVNLPKGSPLPREQVLADREKIKQSQQYKDAQSFANSGKPGSMANPLPGQLPTGERLQWVDTGGRDKDGHPIYGVKATPEQLKKAHGQSFQGGVVKSNASNKKDEQPLRDMQGNPVKLDDMYISGGLGKSAEGKKQSAEAKRKAAQAAPKKESGGAGGSFRVINGQVRFFGSGADAAKEADPVKPTGMR